MEVVIITNEDIQYIIDNYFTMQSKDIAEHLGVTRGMINYYTGKLGLRGKTRLKLSQESKDFICDNYLDMPYSEIGKQVGLSAKQIEGWVRNHIKDKNSKIRQFNDRYFDKISTPDQAYWLGFIYADGWITCSSADRNNGSVYHYEFGIELKREDRYILEQLNNALGGKHTITDLERSIKIADNTHITNTKTSRLRVYSKNLVNDLLRNGIDYNKTNSNLFPIVADNLFFDFLRGYIDGDGCIHKMSDRHLGVHITSANLICLEYIQNKLKNDYNISSKIYCEHIKNRKNKYRLYCFRDKDVKKLLDNIYYNNKSIKLKRKYNVYQNFYGLAA